MLQLYTLTFFFSASGIKSWNSSATQWWESFLLWSSYQWWVFTVSHQSLVCYHFLIQTHWWRLLPPSRNSRGCASCCLAAPATLWGLSFLKAMALSRLLTPFGTYLWRWEQPYTTTPSGSTSTLSRPVRSRPPDDRVDQWARVKQRRWF